MFLTRLSLSDFRSYPDLLLTPGPGLVILAGENGAGKTNVLEAVSLLAPGRGLRGAALGEMARIGGAGGFGVAGRLGEVELGTGALAAAPERRQVRINGAPTAANALGEWLSVLWLTPAMDRLFLEGASGRRRFLDRLTLALDPAHAVHAARYDAAMRARNKLLAEEGAADRDWLAALESRMADHGAAISAARAAAIEALSEALAVSLNSAFPRASVAIDGGGERDAEVLVRELRTGRPRDAAAGRTLIGSHRADLLVTHAGKDQPATRCSTGEQKALLLGIVLAHAELVRTRTGRPLILLLDEVAAHLDAPRREALFQQLQELNSQTWVTGTDDSLFAAVETGACRYRLRSGQVETV